MVNLKAIPAIRYVFFLIAGIVLANYFSFNIYFVSTSIILLLVFLGIALKVKFYPKVKILLWLVIVLMGILSQYFQNDLNHSDHIYFQKDIQAYLCNVSSATETKPNSYKVAVDILAVKKNNNWQKASGKSLLYFNKSTENYPEFGQDYVIKGSPREIEAPKNPLEFDYKKYQARRNIFTHQFLKSNQFVLVGKSNLHPLFNFANTLSNYTHQVFKNIFLKKADLGVAEALIAGIKSEIDTQTIQSYSDTGAIHILSVSGGHVMILFIVLNKILSQFLNNKKLAFCLIVIGVLWLYALFTGLSPSVCRSTLMFSLLQIGNYLNRDKSAINTLAFSAFILLLINPNWLYDVGFQLSYLAVLGILMFYFDLSKLIEFKPIIWNKPIIKLWQISVLSITAQIFTFPLSIYYFHQFPNVFLLTNPVVSVLAFLIVPIGLLVIFCAKIPIIGLILGWLLQNFIVALNISILGLQSLPYATTKGLEIGIISVLGLYLLITLIYTFILKKELKYLKYVTILVLAMSAHKMYKIFKANQTQEITFHFIPKSFGLSILDGRNANFISSDSVVFDPMIYQFHLKNYYDHQGVIRYNYIKTQRNSCLNLTIKQTGILWLKSDMKMKIEPNTQFIVCSNNALRKSEILNDFRGTVILDGSNHKWFIDKMKINATNQPYKLIALYDTGSQTFKI